MLQKPRLRDGNSTDRLELFSLGDIPRDLLFELSKQFVYYSAVGYLDIDGEDWGDIFAAGIGGIHLNSPVGLADVVLEKMAWSAKSIKANNPHNSQKIRLISGRCSPDYSYGISDPHADIAKTGEAVLSIYNERVGLAKVEYQPLRTVVLIRNFQKFEFALFEIETVRYNVHDYEWRINERGNFEGISKNDGNHKFTWQPHGSQLTIHYLVPRSANKFSIRKPEPLDFEETISTVGFTDAWVNVFQMQTRL